MSSLSTSRSRARLALGVSVATVTLIALLGARGVEATTVTVAAANFQYSPASQTINVGDTVHWTFAGDPHSATSRDGLFDSGIMNPGGSYQFTFRTAGVFKYFCQVHPEQMFGTITVKAAAATPGPTVRPTVRPSPRPTARPTVRPSPSPTPTPKPAPTATPAPSASPPPSASEVASPSESAGASLALVETGVPSGATSPGPAPTSPANATDSTPIVVAVVVLAALAGGGLLLARRRRGI
jgi:plastocyanin